jgi:hypothetical protein
MNVLVNMSGEYRDTQLSLIKQARDDGHTVTIVCKTRQDAKFYGSKADSVEVLSQMEPGDAEPELLEQKYHMNLHRLLLDDRLYFTGSPNFPFQNTRTYKESISRLCSKFAFYEGLFDRGQFDLALNPEQAADIIAKRRHIRRRHFHSALYKDYHLWFDSYQRDSSPLLTKFYEAEALSAEPIPLPSYQIVRNRILRDVQLTGCLRNVARDVLRHYYYRAMKYDKAKVFNGLAWARFHMKQKSAYRKLNRMATATCRDFSDLRYVYYPLAGEPEATLSFSAGICLDQLAIIQALAISLPANTYLVVKEHLIAIGARSTEFYETIKRMPNVILASPLERGVDVTANAKAVATIGGTSGLDAAIMGIPVIIFGIKPYYGILPHVVTLKTWENLHVHLEWVFERSYAGNAWHKDQAGKLLRLIENKGIRLDTGDAFGSLMSTL